MKTIWIFLFTCLCMLSACKNNMKKGNVLTKEQRLELITSMDTLYWELSVVDIPFSSNEEITGITKLPKTLYRLFADSDKFDDDTRIARLPEYKRFKPIVVYYNNGSGNAIDLYTLSPDMDIVDRLQGYNIEGEGKSKGHIVRRFHVQPDYKIKVCKDLEDVEIESLLYVIADDGTFKEIRDGLTPATAFESFDNETYYVESFFWKQNDNNLQKTKLKKAVYKLDDEGRVEKVTKASYQPY